MIAARRTWGRPFDAWRWIEASVIGVVAAGIGWLVLSSPAKGLADQGDYERLTVQLRVAPVASQPFSPYWLSYQYRTNQSLIALGVPSAVAHHPALYHYYFGYHSSELASARVALWLHSTFSGGSTFDIRWLGALNGVLLVLAIASLVIATRQLARLPRAVAIVLIVAAFTDVGYLLYLNSFYSEPAEIAGFLLALGLAACTGRARRPWVPFLGFVAAAAFAASAKTEDAVLSVVLVGLGLAIAWLRLPRTSLRIGGSLLALGIGAAGWWNWTSQVPYLRAYQLYDSVFDGLLTQAHPARAVLRRLGASPALARFAGFATANRRSAFALPSAQTGFFGHVNNGAVVRYYLAHPGSLVSLLRTASANELLLRTSYGNLPRPAAAGTQYGPDSPWTLVHRDVIPHSLWFIVMILLAGLVTGCWLMVRRTRPGTTPEVLVAAALLGAIAFVQSPVGGGLDGVVKHAVTFNALFDLVLVTLLALGVDAVRQRVAVARAARAAAGPDLSPGDAPARAPAS